MIKILEYGGNGYSGYSMSNNAVHAYNNGAKPLSKWTKSAIIDAVAEIDPEKAEWLKDVSLPILKKKLLTNGEWHHTSMYYNKTDFYSVEDYDIERLTYDDVQSWKAEKPQKEVKPDNKKYRGDINYIEWTGTRNHPKANKKSLTDVNIEERGSFYIITDDNGNEILRKKIGSNGTYVYKK